ncbi:MAG: hypothetical protein NTZ02_03545, partial [Candidatus Woesearchaeota archaeon]|nr:hypothetical protein [Candidatus Woesearchaeota archaeon]
LNLRHEFTHDINFKDFIHMKDVNSLSENLFFFVHMMEFFIDERLEKVDYIKSITVAKDKN